MTKPTSYSLPLAHRLKHKQLIDYLFDEGRGVTAYPLRLQYATTVSGSTHFQVGFVVPKRLWRKATDRNRIKRLLRDGFRRLHHTSTEVYRDREVSLLLFVVYIGKEKPSQSVIDRSINAILRKLSKELESS